MGVSFAFPTPVNFASKYLNTTLSVDGPQITMPSITENYSDMIILARLRAAAAGTKIAVMAKVNNDGTGTNYRTNYNDIQNNAVVSGNIDGTAQGGQVGYCPTASASANIFGIIRIFIPDWRTSNRFKHLHVDCEYWYNTTIADMGSFHALCVWESTSPITRIDLVLSTAGDFIAGSGASMYLMGRV